MLLVSRLPSFPRTSFLFPFSHLSSSDSIYLFILRFSPSCLVFFHIPYFISICLYRSFFLPSNFIDIIVFFLSFSLCFQNLSSSCISFHCFLSCFLLSHSLTPFHLSFSRPLYFPSPSVSFSFRLLSVSLPAKASCRRKAQLPPFLQVRMPVAR